jgi:antitoxin component HigA of HigAB toxin-antitoxin module
MKTQFDINKMIENGKIQNELDFEKALIVERKLRVLGKENPKLKSVRKKLRDLIHEYEKEHWSGKSIINDLKLRESDIAGAFADIERIFIEHRKQLIRLKLKELDLTQQNLGSILGHKSKTYISELMNGVYPFSIRDLVVINSLLKIDFSHLIPTFLAHEDLTEIKSSIDKLGNSKLKFSIV